jgi:hypothetical protein
LHNLHAVLNVGEDGWLNKVTNRTHTAAADFNLGPLLLAVLDVCQDLIKLELRNLGTLKGIIVERITDDILLDSLLELLDKLWVVNGY